MTHLLKHDLRHETNSKVKAMYHNFITLVMTNGVSTGRMHIHALP